MADFGGLTPLQFIEKTARESRERQQREREQSQPDPETTLPNVAVRVVRDREERRSVADFRRQVPSLVAEQRLGLSKVLEGHLKGTLSKDLAPIILPHIRTTHEVLKKIQLEKLIR